MGVMGSPLSLTLMTSDTAWATKTTHTHTGFNFTNTQSHIRQDIWNTDTINLSTTTSTSITALFSYGANRLHVLSEQLAPKYELMGYFYVVLETINGSPWDLWLVFTGSFLSNHITKLAVIWGKFFVNFHSEPGRMLLLTSIWKPQLPPGSHN